MKLKIVCIGNLKEDWLKTGEKHYLSRIKRYCAIEIIEVKDLALDDKKNGANYARVKETESLSALKKCEGYLICCDINGKRMDSIDFSNTLTEALKSRGIVSFLIGGSIGLSEEAKQKANLNVSFSDMTLPHRLFRVVLLEQIYRAFKIFNGETYHK